jgi:hypothetical protein
MATETERPTWATEMVHPDDRDDSVTEFWRHVCKVRASDFNEDIDVRLVQNGPEAPRQIQVGGLRFTMTESITLVEGMYAGLRHLLGLPEQPAALTAGLLAEIVG